MNKSEPGPSNKCRASTQNKNVPATSTQKLKYSGFRGTPQPCSANYCSSWQRSAVNHDFSFSFFFFCFWRITKRLKSKLRIQTGQCYLWYRKHSLLVFTIRLFAFSLHGVTRGQKLYFHRTQHVFLEVFLSVLRASVLKGLDFFSRSTDKWTPLFIFGSLTAGASVCSAPITPGDVCFAANIFF